MLINEKIRCLLARNAWRQSDLAEKINVSTSTVQKWVTGKNSIPLEMVCFIRNAFGISFNELMDDNVEISGYQQIEPAAIGFVRCGHLDSIHQVFEAGLRGDAKLHRFTNFEGAKCSAIYYDNFEAWWHYREFEEKMIKDWNEGII